MWRLIKRLFSVITVLLMVSEIGFAQTSRETVTSAAVQADTAVAQSQPKLVRAEESVPGNIYADPLKYTLGPDDVIEITVYRHPEFSGIYPINMEGKVQYKFVGDIDVNGMTKLQIEDKIRKAISMYVSSPEVSVTIMEYRSKFIYVLGEVGRPGKYYMRAESIPIREAVVEAGLPTLAAAMRKCRLVTPAKKGKIKEKNVNLYAALYGGNLKYNLEMHAGDVLYVPSTMMAKVMRVISPVAAPVASAASGRTAADTVIANRSAQAGE